MHLRRERAAVPSYEMNEMNEMNEIAPDEELIRRVIKRKPSGMSFETWAESASTRAPRLHEKHSMSPSLSTTLNTALDDETQKVLNNLSRSPSHSMTDLACGSPTFATPPMIEERLVETSSIETVRAPHSAQFYTTIAMLCLVSVMASMESVIVAACLSAIADDLQGTSIDSFWVGTGFLLSQTATIPIYGTLSDIFGRKIMMLIAIALFFGASILCALAQSMTWLITARVVQGLGAGGLLNLTSVIISDITTMQERGKYISFGAASWSIGNIGGIPLGGAIAQYASWRWIFWINLPMALIAFAGLTWSLHLETDKSSFRAKLARIDYVGISIFSFGTVALLIGLSSGGSVHPWTSSGVITPIISGGFFYVIFLLLQWKILQNPMMPLRLFKDRSAQAAIFVIWCHGLVVWSISYYMIIFFLGAKQQGRLGAAVSVLSGTAWGAPSGVVAGVLVKKTLHFQKIIWVGLLFLTFGTAIGVTMTPTANKGIIYGLRVFVGIGAGILFPTPICAVQIVQEGEDIGMATSFTAFFRSLGQSFGVALGGVIFQNEWTIQVKRKLADGTIPSLYMVDSNQAEVAYEIIDRFPEGVQMAYRYVYADSLKTVWWAMTGVSGAALVVSFLIKNQSMDRNVHGKQAFVNKNKQSKESDV